MSVSLLKHTAFLRVRYADTDQMGIVYYGKYFEYFEVARTELLRSCGLPYAEIEAAGFGLPVLQASAKYFRGAKYDELLRIECSMETSHSPRLVIRYAVFNEADTPIAEGETTLGFIQSSTGKPSRPPKLYTEAIERHTTAKEHAEHS